MDIVTIDFETHVIMPRPHYPPEPVSVAIKWPDGESEFLAWGHPSGNTCSAGEARLVLERIWRAAHEGSDTKLLFHNAKFDLAVAQERLDLEPPLWCNTLDTSFLAFLADPHARQLDLKTLAHEWLDWPPEEKDAVAEWIWEHRKYLVATYGGKITRAKTGPNSPGAWLSRCPADIVEPYAIGDVDRTRALFEELYPLIDRWGMVPAFEREHRVLPVFMENERRGLRADTDLLDHDLNAYSDDMAKVESFLRDRLRSRDLNLDADEDVAEALERAGVVDADRWTRTKTGRRSVSKVNLTPDMFNDADVASAMGYRNRLQTCLSTFLRPWADQAWETGGRIHTTWNQVRGDIGTRTGRPSTSRPNILNIPKQWEGRDDGYQHPSFLPGLRELPLVRKYILPEEGHVWLHRDYSGQEVRVLAAYEQGALWRAYRDDPDLDPHGWVRDELYHLTGIELERTKVKTLNFQAIYGGGVSAAQKALGCSYAEAQQYKAFHDQALPGRRIVADEIKRLVRREEPVVTLDGRVYFCEKPKHIGGRLQTFDYKLINYICQGSAAGMTKEALARWYWGRGDALFTATVYDEINVSAPVEQEREQMEWLRHTMEDMSSMTDVPMVTEGKRGFSWGALEEVE